MAARILAIAILSAASLPWAAAAADLDAEQVRLGIDKAIHWIKSKQSNNGSWPDYADQPGGVTALCALALLNAGVSVDDPSIQLALAHLRNIPPQKTYAVSLQTMALCAGEPKKDLLLIRRNAKWLEENQSMKGAKPGTWSYPGGGGDNSNTQFAMLALYEAERAGVPVSEKTWRLSLEYWQGTQNLDGSWGYHPGAPGSGSMTCAGISSVVIAASQLNSGDAAVVNGQVRCCGKQLPNEAIERAMEWLGDDRNFSVSRNPGQGGQQTWLLYYLYGLERAGRMTARRFIGSYDWYREGAAFLIGRQDKFSGFWPGLDRLENSHTIGTSLGLLFLAKGRRPVLVSKLKHDPLDDWNHHRSDLANLTSYVESRWKRDLTWQVVDAERATVDDLLQSPVIFFNGRNAPQLNLIQKKNLREYIEKGGFLFAEACCKGIDFDRGFRELMAEIFPEEEYRLRLLPPEHPIWRAEETIDPQYVRELWGIDLGCRTSVVYCPQDLSCYWELSHVGRDLPYPKRVQAEIAACNATGLNVLAYATNREVKFKYEIPTAQAEKPEDQAARGKLYVAKLMHGGGCNAAPAALTNLLRVAGEKLKVRVSTEHREVGMADPQVFDYHLVFMHGRHSFRLTPAERKGLKQYLDRGGVLFADAICSNLEFDKSFREEIKTIYPNQPLERIPAVHPMFSGAFGGDDISIVSRRQPERAAVGGPIKVQVRESEPYLEGVKLGDRWAVIYSRYDLSCALENHDSLECEGYIRKDAARIGLNVLIYSLHQ